MIQALQTTSADQAEPYQPELYIQLLYASVIDTLAGTVMPKRSNKNRFVYFVERFCQWPDGKRVSLTHLLQLLRKNPDPAFEKLRVWALEQYKALPVQDGKLIPISDDPSFDEVNANWPKKQEHRTPLDGVDLNSLNHFHLLYAYRNSLVHELRIPGYGWNFAERTTPFYHGMRHILADDSTEITMELVYPRNFLHHLCDTALKQLKIYFIKNELNPYDSHIFGSYWIRELNR